MEVCETHYDNVGYVHTMNRLMRILSGLAGLIILASCSSGGGPTAPRVDLSDRVIVAFGDSITSGQGDSSRPAGYPYRLEQALLPGFPNVIVLNRGVPGERTYEGVRRIDTVLEYDRPDYVLILEGVNNINDSGTRFVDSIVCPTRYAAVEKTIVISGP